MASFNTLFIAVISLIVTGVLLTHPAFAAKHDGKHKKIAPPPAEIAPPPADIAPPPSDIAPSPSDIAPPPADIAPPPADIAPSPSDIAPPPADIAPSPSDIAPSPIEIPPSIAADLDYIITIPPAERKIIDDCSNQMSRKCGDDVVNGMLLRGTVSDECCSQLVKMGKTCHRHMVTLLIRYPDFRPSADVIKESAEKIWSGCDDVVAESPS